MKRRLEARRLEYGDLPTRVQWFNSEKIFSAMPLDAPFSVSETQKWYSQSLLNQHRRDFSFWLSEQDIAPKLAAMGGLVHLEPVHRRCELYILVDPMETGKGIGSAAVKWMCNYAFAILNKEKVFLYTTEQNESARRFYERLGFVCEGRLRKHHYHHGNYQDRYIHGLLREEWLQQSWRHSTGTLPFEVDC